MTQSVAKKNSIPEKTWRRETDSPKWWIVFTFSSLILHILLFWLISLYKFDSSLNRLKGSAATIEFIEISPKKSSKAKPQIKNTVKSKPSSKTVNKRFVKSVVPPQSLQNNTKPKTFEPPASVNDSNAIALNNQREIAEQRQRELAEQKQQELAEQRQRELAEQRQREIAEQRQREIAEQRQREIAEQRQRELAEQQQRELAQQKQRELAEQRQREIAEQRQRELTQRQQANPLDGQQITDQVLNNAGQTPEQRRKAPPAPIKKPQLNRGGILTANWRIDSSFIQEKDKPDNPPRLRNNIINNFAILTPSNSNLPSAEFEVYLTIDEEGRIINAHIENLEMRRKYQTYINQNLLNKQFFFPATNIDPRTGEANSPVAHSRILIKIQ